VILKSPSTVTPLLLYSLRPEMIVLFECHVLLRLFWVGHVETSLWLHLFRLQWTHAMFFIDSTDIKFGTFLNYVSRSMINEIGIKKSQQNCGQSFQGEGSIRLGNLTIVIYLSACDNFGVWWFLCSLPSFWYWYWIRWWMLSMWYHLASLLAYHFDWRHTSELLSL